MSGNFGGAIVKPCDCTAPTVAKRFTGTRLQDGVSAATCRKCRKRFHFKRGENNND